MAQTVGYTDAKDEAKIGVVPNMEYSTVSTVDDIQSKLDEHIKEFDRLSAMYIEYTSGNTQQVQQLEDNLIKYATALARNLVEVRHMIDTLKQTDNNIQEELDMRFANIYDSLDKLNQLLDELKVRTVKRDDYPGSPNTSRKYRSFIRLGNIVVPSEKKFCKFSRWLWRKLLGIEIRDYYNINVAVVHKTGYNVPWGTGEGGIGERYEHRSN